MTSMIANNLCAQNLPLNTTRTNSTASSSEVKTSKPSAIEQRVAQLQQSTVSLAQDFLGLFAKQLFGDAAKGMSVSFDQIELSASSSASASGLISQNANGTTSAAAFKLTDSSNFVGRGTLTTADGKQFQFELTVSYQSTQEASFAQHTSNNASAAPDRSNLLQSFNGTADDLLSQISADPVKLPFSLQQDNQLQGLGEMMLKLLNLNGGDRYFDWQGQTKPKIDQQA